MNSDNTAGAEDNRFVNTKDREDMHTGWVWYNCIIRHSNAYKRLLLASSYSIVIHQVVQQGHFQDFEGKSGLFEDQYGLFWSWSGTSPEFETSLQALPPSSTKLWIVQTRRKDQIAV